MTKVCCGSNLSRSKPPLLIFSTKWYLLTKFIVLCVTTCVSHRVPGQGRGRGGAAESILRHIAEIILRWRLGPMCDLSQTQDTNIHCFAFGCDWSSMQWVLFFHLSRISQLPLSLSNSQRLTRKTSGFLLKKVNSIRIWLISNWWCSLIHSFYNETKSQSMPIIWEASLGWKINRKQKVNNICLAWLWLKYVSLAVSPVAAARPRHPP